MNHKSRAKMIERAVTNIRLELGIQSESRDVTEKKISSEQKNKIRQIISESTVNKKLICSILGVDYNNIYSNRTMANK